MNEASAQAGPNPETRLFNLVRNWFHKNPGALIPHEAWYAKLLAYGLIGKPEYHITHRSHLITVKGESMIQALASVSLGEGTNRLAAILTHLNVDVLSIKDSSMKSTWASLDAPGDDNRLELPRFRIARELMLAFDQIPAQAERLKLLCEYENTNPDLTMGLLFLERPDLWHLTRVEECLKAYQDGTSTHSLVTWEMPNGVFQLGLQWGYQYQDSQIIELLRRAGVLVKEACVENCFSPMFYRGLLESAAISRNPDAIAIVGAMNSVRDEGVRRTVADKIIRAFSLPSNRKGHGADTDQQCLALIDPASYPCVPASKVALINTVIGPSEDFSPDEGTLLGDLSNEILAVPPTEFGTHHFTCLAKFSLNWSNAHTGSNVDVNRLVRHVLESLEQFLDKKFHGSAAELHTHATKQTAAFLAVSLKLAKPDYSLLNELGSHSQGMLALAGYDIRQFTKMSNRDKGRVLSDELGL